jgi:hypothetical protein
MPATLSVFGHPFVGQCSGRAGWHRVAVALNGGSDEYIASISTWPYGQLKRRLPPDFQANHLNQNAAFRDIVPMDDGLSMGMRENAITAPGTPHYNFHQSLEGFWEPYRPGREQFGKKPTNATYGEAVKKALQAGGLSPEEATYLAGRAAEQRASRNNA